jgi:type IV pilus assembly protein PilC
MIYEQLAYLLSAQITVIDSLIILKQHDVLDEFKKGKTLSSILKEKNIAAFIVSRIIQGEKTATLHEACGDIALVLRKEKEIKNKILLTLLYPCVLFLVTIGIVIFLVAYIFPKMMPLFIGMKSTLPFTTRTVLFVSDSFARWWWLYAILFGLATTLSFWKREFLLFKLPVLKKWYMTQKISQYFSRIGPYLDSGIGLDEASTECAYMEDSKYIKEILIHIATSVRQGISFSYIIEQQSMFPKEIHSMLLVGENSGRLGNMCKKIGEMYEQKFSSYTKSITSAVEPVSMLCMGFAVCFIALSMITPLYSITQHVR